MSAGALERALGRGGRLVIAGLVVQLGSFFWNHPLAFLAFALVGGGLVMAGLATFALTAYRERAWRDGLAAASPRRRES